MLHMVDEPGLF